MSAAGGVRPGRAARGVPLHALLSGCGGVRAAARVWPGARRKRINGLDDDLFLELLDVVIEAQLVASQLRLIDLREDERLSY